MKELVIISGKGGTGKTSLTACFAYLARNKVFADCDVDAADLHILVQPRVLHEEIFMGGVKACIDKEKCTSCALCTEACRFGAISQDLVVNHFACEGCGVCSRVCPEKAIDLNQSVSGKWFISETRMGSMVHAELSAGEENSGKLVALVRNQAKILAKNENADLIIVDGSPGLGCPVISSLTGADYVLVVTEPTLSGLHDMERVLKLVKSFRIPSFVVVNKADINPGIAEQVRRNAENSGALVLGDIPYDPSVVEMMVQRRCVVEKTDSPAGEVIRSIWEHLLSNMAA